jgi:hypothetical protein
VRQLARGPPGFPPNSGQQAGLKESGSKLPHSKTTARRFRQEQMVTITQASYWLAKFRS